jgi:hypothetical protein
MQSEDRRSWVWSLPDGGASNDWPRFRSRLESVAVRRDFDLIELATDDQEPLLLLRREAADSAVRRLLVAAGFHGEEPAGPWGVLDFLEHAPEPLLYSASLCLLPLVNVSGFRAGTRLNARGENPNRGYRGVPGEAPSQEGRVLLRQRATLRSVAYDGLLTCHEDVLLHHAYLYSLERAAAPGELTRALLAVNGAHFPLHPDGIIDGCTVAGGIIFNHHDGSFESWLMNEGIAYAACVETPGQHPLAQRIAAHRAMIEAFVRGPVQARDQ